MFYVVIGFREEGRKNPIALWLGSDRGEIQTAVDAAPADIIRTEIGFFDFHSIGRRAPGSKPAVIEDNDMAIVETVLQQGEEIDRLTKALAAAEDINADLLTQLSKALSPASTEVTQNSPAIDMAQPTLSQEQAAQPPAAALAATAAAVEKSTPAAAESDVGPTLNLSAESLAEADEPAPTPAANGGKGGSKKGK